jgi:hypothetical protein
MRCSVFVSSQQVNTDGSCIKKASNPSPTLLWGACSDQLQENPAHLGLFQQQARARIGGMVDNAVQFGGCLTINWHDRSLAPGRLWAPTTANWCSELKDRGAWFATGGRQPHGFGSTERLCSRWIPRLP